MKNLYDEFLRKRIARVKELQAEYETRLDKARNKQLVHRKYYNHLLGEYKTLQVKLSPYDRFFIDLNDELEEDVSKTFASVFYDRIRIIPDNKRNAILVDLIHLNAIDTFLELWDKEDESFQTSETDEKINPQSAIHWKGKNETEFVQLVYALIEGNYIQGAGIENTINGLAQFLNYPLGKNWQTNHSSSIHKSNADYKPRIFSHLEESYTRYQQKQIEKKRKN